MSTQKKTEQSISWELSTAPLDIFCKSKIIPEISFKTLYDKIVFQTH